MANLIFLYDDSDSDGPLLPPILTGRHRYQRTLIPILTHYRVRRRQRLGFMRTTQFWR